MPENFAESFSQAVSKTRFGAFEKGDGARLGLARYLWNLSLCEALYPSFHTCSPLAASLGRIDRFSAVQMAQIEPYLEHASQLIIE